MRWLKGKVCRKELKDREFEGKPPSSKTHSLISRGISKLSVLFALWVPFALWAGTDSGSIMLVNDSPFILSAVIQAADGTFLGQFSIQPGQQKNFTTNLSSTGYKKPGTPNVSLTPYTVIWQCPSEGHYSMCTQVSPGALCKANECPGPHFCRPKQENKQQKPSSSLQSPEDSDD